MLAAEGEIGAGRDITTIVPGGFSSAGAINGNLRPRAAAAFLNGALGAIVANPAAPAATPPTAAYDTFTPTDILPYYSIEKKVGSTVRSANEQLTLLHTDCVINTFSMVVSSGALSTFSAGIMSAGEQYQAVPLVDETLTGQPFSYGVASNDLLVFHGGRVLVGDTGAAYTALIENDQLQSLEVAINNNVQGDEYTIRPSRFIHSFTEGIRDIEVNITVVFNDFHQYQQYTYGASGSTQPGYHLYQGQLDFTLANWQPGTGPTGELFNQATGGNIPATNAQAIHTYLPSIVYASFPVSLASGRIVVTTNARGIKPIGSTTPIVQFDVRPTGAAF